MNDSSNSISNQMPYSDGIPLGFGLGTWVLLFVFIFAGVLVYRHKDWFHHRVEYIFLVLGIGNLVVFNLIGLLFTKEFGGYLNQLGIYAILVFLIYHCYKKYYQTSLVLVILHLFLYFIEVSNEYFYLFITNLEQNDVYDSTVVKTLVEASLNPVVLFLVYNLVFIINIARGIFFKPKAKVNG